MRERAPLGRFFPAEAYHLEYCRRNPDQAHRQAWITPKIVKLRSKYAERLGA